MKCEFDLLENNLKTYISSGKIAGGALAIAIGEDCVFSTYQGYEDFENKKVIDENSVFRLASMTKPVTSAAILICQDQGLLDIEDNISKFLPKFKLMYLNAGDEKNLIKGKEINREIKIADLLTHTAGFGGSLESPQYDAIPFIERNLKDNVDKYASFLLPNNPGETFAYSGVVGFDILARIVEVASNMDYESFLKKYIFNPLGMNSTTYKYNKDNINHQVKMYKHENNQLILSENQERSFECIQPGEVGGGAALLSTINDYIKFAIMLTNYGVYKGKRILSEKAVRQMSTAYLDLNKTKGIDIYANWGLGVFIRGRQNPEVNFHLNPGSFGWSGAYGTHYFSDPSLKLTVVYMHNSQTYGGAGAAHTIELEKDVMNFFKKA